MKDWLHASKKDIENMTFDQAKEIVEKQIRLGKEGGQWCPREHLKKALEIILDSAELYELRKEKREVSWNPVTKQHECAICGTKLYINNNFCPLCGCAQDWDNADNHDKIFKFSIDTEE